VHVLDADAPRPKSNWRKDSEMLTAVALEEQLAAVARNRLRVLVVGAGVAGLTLAQVLRAEGWTRSWWTVGTWMPIPATCWD
jgi:NADPH-dependent 2,4-dienoyl-CoA reductase/sulfur reductase-like enzyme